MSSTRPPPSVFLLKVQRHGLLIIFVVVLIKQMVAVAVVPPWLVPDEAAHLQYVRTLMLERRVPELRGRLIVYDEMMNSFFRRGDIRQIGYAERKKFELEKYWQDHPTERSTSARYNPAGTYSPIYYAAIGWPLWFIGSQPIETQLLVLRFVSSLLLLVVVAMTWRIVHRLSGNRGLAATVALLVGFHPGMSVNFAGINNDAGLIASSSLILATLASWWYQRPSWRHILFVGMSAGLVALIKPVGASVIIMAALTLLAVFGWRERGAWKRAVMAGVIGVAVGSLWMVRERYLGYSSFLTDADLWKIQSRLQEDTSFGAIIRGDVTYWWPASFFTYWGEYFAKLKIPTVLPLGYFATILGLSLAAIVGWVYAWRQRALDTVARRSLGFGLLAIGVHELWLWLVHLQTIFRYHDYQFLYHGRYRLMVAPVVLLLIIGGLERLRPPYARPFVRGGLVSLFIIASSYVLWIAAHV